MKAANPFAMPFWEARLFRDAHGREILANSMLRGERPDSVPAFVGSSQCLIEQPDGKGRAWRKLRFPIQAQTIAEAFAAFDAAEEQAILKTGGTRPVRIGDETGWWAMSEERDALVARPEWLSLDLARVQA